MVCSDLSIYKIGKRVQGSELSHRGHRGDARLPELQLKPSNGNTKTLSVNLKQSRGLDSDMQLVGANFCATEV